MSGLKSFGIFALGGVLFLQVYLGYGALIIAPLMVFALVSIRNEQRVGYFTREHDPYIFWPAVGLLVLVGIFGLQDSAKLIGLIQ
ncbi:MAG: hypothetical protein AAGK02_05240 [Pseudomonadota bacterium]